MMSAKFVELIKGIPVWVPLVFLAVAIFLFTAIPSLLPALFLPENQLGFLLSVNGRVQVSDGFFESPAQPGALMPKGPRTLLITRLGNASLSLPGSTSVVLDANSTIEFSHEKAKTPNASFAFNLTGGRALVINSPDSFTPVQVYVSGNYTARVFRGVMGLRADEESGQAQIDCLLGPCLVNGETQLASGQSAASGPGSAVMVSGSIPYASWIALQRTGGLEAAMSIPLTGLDPSLTPGRAAFPLLGGAQPAGSNWPDNSLASSSMTAAASTLTHAFETTSTPTPWRAYTPTPTLQHSEGDPSRTPMPTPTRSASPIPPGQTPVITSTPQPTSIQLPTDVPPTTIPTDNPTANPTAVPTQVPTQVATPAPTSTPANTPTHRPTNTKKPPKGATIAPTQAPPTAAPTDAPAPSETPAPIAMGR